MTIILLPRQPGEGTKLERTSSIYAKIENYQEGIVLFSKSPLIGHGYNNLSFVRNYNPDSHAASGFDGSLLTILTTTGMVGFSLFILGINSFFHQSSLLKKTMLVSLLVHSIFANSLLYPWIFLSFILF
jgi:O-antigen ligase